MKKRIAVALLELRWPLIALAAALLTGGAMVSATLYVEHKKLQANDQAQSRLRAARLQTDNLQRDQANFSEYLTSYEALEDKGLFGSEERLAWIEFMNRLSAERRVKSVSYEIGAERPVALAGPEGKNVDVLSSVIQLRMGFLHEGDLVHVLQSLRSADTGFYRIDNCAVRRAEASVSSGVNGNLAAECRLQWIVLRQKGGGGVR
jgi:hypothetical protein